MKWTLHVCVCFPSLNLQSYLSFFSSLIPKMNVRDFPYPNFCWFWAPLLTLLSCSPLLLLLKYLAFSPLYSRASFFFFLSQQEHDSKVAYSSDEYNFPLLLSLWLMTVALLSVNIHCLSVSGPGIRLTEKWLFPQDCQAPDWYKVCFYKEEDKGTLSRLQSAAWERSLRKKEMWSQLKTKSQESLLSL